MKFFDFYCLKGMRSMNIKFRLIGAIASIIGGILIVIGSILDQAFPKPLWIVAAVCCFLGAISNLMNCKPTAKKKDKQ